MTEKDLKFHRELRKELKKSKREIDIHKTLTLLFFILALTAGAFYLSRTSPAITGLVIQEPQNTNICYFNTGNMRMPYTKEPISCRLISSNSTNLRIEITNNFFPEQRDITIKDLSVRDCKSEFSILIKPDQSKEVTINCPNLSAKEELVLGYEDMRTKITYRISGKVIKTNLL